MWRAKFPNGFDIEQFNGQLPDMREVAEWVEPPALAPPAIYYKDLKAAGEKNASTMTEYNEYATGAGGPCAHWANDGETYVCSNITAGGWEFIEKGFANAGRLGFPVAMRYNASLLPALGSWVISPAPAAGDWYNQPTLTVWHNQGAPAAQRARRSRGGPPVSLFKRSRRAPPRSPRAQAGSRPRTPLFGPTRPPPR
jgi:hypothetical protein